MHSIARRGFRRGSLIQSTLVLSAMLLIPSCGEGSSTPPPPPPPLPAAAPAFWPPIGTYSPTQITLSDTTANATIYYITDGSTPTTSSPKYVSPIAISSSTTIKAMAASPGFSPSRITAAIYTVPAQNGVGPAVSIVLTTDDQSRTMQPQAGTNFTTAASSPGRVIYVDETQTYQADLVGRDESCG